MNETNEMNMYYGMTERRWIGELINGAKKNLELWDKGVISKEESLEKIGLLCREAARICEGWR